ncbi:PREDICTED: uncharacterized protein LOC101386477 [Odobenus rosmarus divergens]|uniref:Uncharacterized protein LOC101386477 n=1 Tax=Odobenus rosmarus divergens TaxID=9708 RepID=A0A9B0HG21_ODORO
MPVTSIIITRDLQVSVVGGDRVGVKVQIDVCTVSHSVGGTSESVQNQMGTVGTGETSEKSALIGNYSLSPSQGLASHQHLRVENGFFGLRKSCGPRLGQCALTSFSAGFSGVSLLLLRVSDDVSFDCLVCGFLEQVGETIQGKVDPGSSGVGCQRHVPQLAQRSCQSLKNSSRGKKRPEPRDLLSQAKREMPPEKKTAALAVAQKVTCLPSGSRRLRDGTQCIIIGQNWILKNS